MTAQYYNYRRNEAELNEEIIFCANNPEDSRHYGNIQRIMQPTSRTLAGPTEELIELTRQFLVGLWRNEGREFSTEEVIEALMPADIVSSASAWDNIEFINFLYDEGWFDNYDGFLTPDGAVFFEATPENVVAVNYLN